MVLSNDIRGDKMTQEIREIVFRFSFVSRINDFLKTVI